MTTMLRLSAILVLICPSPLAAQNGVPNLEALALRVGQAHRPHGPVPAVDAFRCALQLHLFDTREDQGGQADLEVRFLRWQIPGTKRVRTLIRYELTGGEQRNVRGQDRNGPWHLHQEKPTDLTGAQFVQDLKTFREHTNLAKQLVRFLSPDDVLRALRDPGEVAREPLVLTRNEKIESLAVEGDLERFPIMQNGGEDGPAHVKVYVDEATDQLRAVDVWPIVDGQRDATRGERILLDDMRERGGVMVPHLLVHLWRDARGQLRGHSSVRITRLELRPPLTVDDFDRG